MTEGKKKGRRGRPAQRTKETALLLRFYTMASANDYLGLPYMTLDRLWKRGEIKHDAVEIYRNGRERPLFTELTLKHFALDLEAKKVA